MTDSFQNIVGTPRDAVPDISKTNYMETGADLTPAMLEAQDDAIKDTKRHFDQMVELEELAAQKFDKRLNSLTNIIGNVAKIRKAQLAKDYNIRGYPTIMHVDGKQKATPYEGGRKQSDFLKELGLQWITSWVIYITDGWYNTISSKIEVTGWYTIRFF